MDASMMLRTFATAMTILAAALVAANLNARATFAGFIIFIAALLAWMANGLIENKTSLVVRISCCSL
jgi:hypothetical protein